MIVYESLRNIPATLVQDLGLATVSHKFIINNREYNVHEHSYNDAMKIAINEYDIWSKLETALMTQGKDVMLDATPLTNIEYDINGKVSYTRRHGVVSDFALDFYKLNSSAAEDQKRKVPAALKTLAWLKEHCVERINSLAAMQHSNATKFTFGEIPSFWFINENGSKLNEFIAGSEDRILKDVNHNYYKYSRMLFESFDARPIGIIDCDVCKGNIVETHMQWHKNSPECTQRRLVIDAKSSGMIEVSPRSDVIKLILNKKINASIIPSAIHSIYVDHKVASLIKVYRDSFAEDSSVESLEQFIDGALSG